MSWREGVLGDFIGLKRGHDLPERERKPGNVPIVSSSGITGFHNIPKVSAPGVVTGRYGTIGEVFLVEEDYWPLNTSLYVEHFKGNDPAYVAYYLRSIDLARMVSTGAVPGVNRNVLHALPARFVSYDQQLRIVEKLQPYDDLIENNRRRIALLEQSARLLYREWFVHFRFPGHEHVKVVDGVPEGWEKQLLGALLTLQRGFDLPVGKRKEGNVPVFASTGVTGYHNQAKVQEPGIVTGRSGSLGRVMMVLEDYWPLNTTLWVKEFKKVDHFFTYYLLRGLGLEGLNGGAAVPTLNRNDVHRIDVLLPTANLRRNFSEFVSPIFEQIQKFEIYSKKLAQARDLLLPRLMNGEIAL